jgi:hypothetical protein
METLIGEQTMVKRFELSLSDELLDELGWQESEVPSRVREALVMDLLRLDRIAEAQAAKLLELDRWELLDLMGRHHVAAVQLSVDELEQESKKRIERDS